MVTNFQHQFLTYHLEDNVLAEEGRGMIGHVMHGALIPNTWLQLPMQSGEELPREGVHVQSS